MACIGDFYYTYLLMTKFKEVKVEIAVTEKVWLSTKPRKEISWNMS